jgi:hypothetical protein
MVSAHGTVIILSAIRAENQTKSLIASFAGTVRELQKKLVKEGVVFE